jgi:hypothetical protein
VIIGSGKPGQARIAEILAITRNLQSQVAIGPSKLDQHVFR